MAAQKRNTSTAVSGRAPIPHPLVSFIADIPDEGNARGTHRDCWLLPKKVATWWDARAIGFQRAAEFMATRPEDGVFLHMIMASIEEKHRSISNRNNLRGIGVAFITTIGDFARRGASVSNVPKYVESMSAEMKECAALEADRVRERVQEAVANMKRGRLAKRAAADDNKRAHSIERA